MENLTCTRCGGTIDPKTYRCEYCGTYYEKPATANATLKVIQAPANIIPLSACAAVDKEIIVANGELAAKYVRSEMAHKLATELAKYMDIITYEEPRTYQIMVKGRIRVVAPEYRYKEVLL